MAGRRGNKEGSIGWTLVWCRPSRVRQSRSNGPENGNGEISRRCDPEACKTPPRGRRWASDDDQDSDPRGTHDSLVRGRALEGGCSIHIRQLPDGRQISRSADAGERKVTDIKVADVDRLLAAKLADGLSPSTVHRIRALISQCLDQGVRWSEVPTNVARPSRPPKMVRPEGRTLTQEQAQSLLEALKGHRHESLYLLMLSTGMRRGEALGLKWDDLNFDVGVARVKRNLKREGGRLVTADTKTLKSRRAVNLPNPVIGALIENRELQEKERAELGAAWIATDFVFTTSVGTPIDPRNLYREFAQICQRAGLGHWHPHELRHSAASLMLASGVKLQVVSEVLGHSSIRMTADVYGHILDPDRQQAASAMSKVLWGE